MAKFPGKLIQEPTSFPGSLLFTPQEAREGRGTSFASWGVKRRDPGNEVVQERDRTKRQGILLRVC